MEQVPAKMKSLSGRFYDWFEMDPVLLMGFSAISPVILNQC